MMHHREMVGHAQPDVHFNYSSGVDTPTRTAARCYFMHAPWPGIALQSGQKDSLLSNYIDSDLHPFFPLFLSTIQSYGLHKFLYKFVRTGSLSIRQLRKLPSYIQCSADLNSK